MKKFVLPLLLLSSILLSACTLSSTQTSDTSEKGSLQLEEKKGDTTKTGVLVKQGEKYYIKAETGEMEEVESYSVDFTEFESKTVSVTGQYSGDTLFVGSIELATK